MSRTFAETESSIFSVLASAETVRDGATQLLGALAPHVEESSAALAIKDRDGFTLHVLAEIDQGSSVPMPAAWPAALAPQVALGAASGVDAATGVAVIPLRSHARVVGALLLADARVAAPLVGDAEFSALLDSAAATLRALVARSDDDVQRHAVALRSMDAIVDAVAHQIANPLTAASAIAQLLADDSDEERRTAIRQIKTELDRAFLVIQDMLEFHRDTHAQDGILDLGAFVERALRFRGYVIREQGITLYTEPIGGVLPVRVDARGLEHVLLIALKYAELQSHGSVNRSISVAIIESGSEYHVEITDSGRGDLPDVDPRYFDLPLSRVEHYEARPVDRAPDLGLVDSILRACGGRLAVRASKTAGTTLSLQFPRAAASGAAHART